MANEISLLVNGVCGRMGLRIIHLATADKRFQVAGGLEHADHPKLGMDLGLVAALPELEGIAITHAWPRDRAIDLVIDVSSPEGTAAMLPLCKADRIPMVVATTGHSVQQMNALKEAAHDMPLLVAANLSLGMNLMMKLVGQAAASLKTQDFDIEIIERHHRFKEDAPSGTALKFGEIVAKAMGQTEHLHGREGRIGKRKLGEIGYHAVRAGDNPGEHTLVFGMLGETIELKVAATNRDCYAQGALVSAKWLADKPAGLYGMNDVLGL